MSIDPVGLIERRNDQGALNLGHMLFEVDRLIDKGWGGRRHRGGRRWREERREIFLFSNR